jgi:dihydrofolate reductase
MAKLISSILVTLDGFAAGPKGELDMFPVGEEFFELSEQLTQQAEAALYGKGTYQIMSSYWPNAGSQPDASKHDKQHSEWYNRVDKYVLSTTLKEVTDPKTKIISTNVVEEINKLKQQKQKAIQIFGSPGAVRSLMQLNLIDEYWIFTAPILIGKGLPLFTGIKQRVKLKLLSTKAFASGITASHYEKA